MNLYQNKRKSSMGLFLFNLAKALIILESLLIIMMFTKQDFGLYELIYKYNSLSMTLITIHMISMILLPLYGVIRIIFFNGINDFVNYLAILAGLLYFILVYQELVIDKAL